MKRFSSVSPHGPAAHVELGELRISNATPVKSSKISRIPKYWIRILSSSLTGEEPVNGWDPRGLRKKNQTLTHAPVTWVQQEKDKLFFFSFFWKQMPNSGDLSSLFKASVLHRQSPNTEIRRKLSPRALFYFPNF
jgi:hypothetical protein